MNCCSPAGSWTSSTSASPLRPRARAWPLPTATARTSMPVSSRNRGSSNSSSPLSWALVVVARVRDSTGACRAEQPTAARRRANSHAAKVLFIGSVFPSVDHVSPYKGSGPRVPWSRKEHFRGSHLDQPAVQQQGHPVRHAPRLEEVVGRPDHGGPPPAAQAGDGPLDGRAPGGSPVGPRPHPAK